MLEMELELNLFLSSVFDRMSRSESNDVATAFEMHEIIQRDCTTTIYPNNALRCVLPNSLNDVNRLYLKKQVRNKIKSAMSDYTRGCQSCMCVDS
jgi:hypothetical protein